MRLPGAARGGAEGARPTRQVAGAEARPDELARGGDGGLRHRHAVGADIGEESRGLAVELDPLVKRLGEAHGLAHAEAELARGLLLEGRGGEGRDGVAPGLVAFEGGDAEDPLADPPGGLPGDGGGRERRAVERRPVEPAQARREGAAAVRRDAGVDRPVLGRLERLDFGLAGADEAQRHRLHAPRRADAADLAPQQRREVEADQVIERPARLLRAHQVHVDLARVRHRLAHRVPGDLVERDAPDRPVPERAFVTEPGEHLPGDRLALAVGIGGEHQRVGIAQRRRDPAQHRSGAAPCGVDHGEAARGVDRAVLRRQVRHMAPCREDLVAVAEPGADRLRLGRGFDDDDVHGDVSPMHAAPAPAEADCRRRDCLSRSVAGASVACLPGVLRRNI